MEKNKEKLTVQISTNWAFSPIMISRHLKQARPVRFPATLGVPRREGARGAHNHPHSLNQGLCVPLLRQYLLQLFGVNHQLHPPYTVPARRQDFHSRSIRQILNELGRCRMRQ
ncbi:hypothetical protein TorRG33x02_260350 [Trema orientale]|uniref:Uncharacterized protein n=1 Tax=Trema orientale TaxID=63057 RepID=A0A2P5D6V8_TREOI|nr:hypothetical protein TorRG33x02_260350 [Trema orientale]